MSIYIQNSSLPTDLPSIKLEKAQLQREISVLKEQQKTITHIILSIITFGGLAIIRQIKIMILEDRVIKLERKESLINAKPGSLDEANEMINFVKRKIENIPVIQADQSNRLDRHKKILLQLVDTSRKLYEMNNQNRSFNYLCDDLITSFKQVIEKENYNDVKPVCEELINYIEGKKKIA
jgi:hypothetical protein